MPIFKPCCPTPPPQSCGSYLHRLVDAKLTFWKTVTCATVDLIESLFHHSCDRTDCKSNKPVKSCQHSCQIPQPCWMPTSLGEVHCEICESGRGTLTIWLTNEDYQPQTYRFSNKSDGVSGLTFSPAEVTLEAKQRTKIVAVFDAPPQPKGSVMSCYDLLIWIDSCRDYYLRWTLSTSPCPKPCCVEVCVEDIPDYELHWYDHFYSLKPCLGGAS